MSDEFRFQRAASPARWYGRYGRVVNRESVFHCRASGTVGIEWSDAQASEKFLTQMVDSEGSRALGRAVNDVKSGYVGYGGGSFIINEFGQVICALGSDSGRYYVGSVSGVPRFQDPRNGGTFDLKADPASPPGTPWRWPYLGVKFVLSSGGEIYFKQDDGEGKVRHYPRRQDWGLIENLQRVRGTGCRFLVNLHGAVLTKVPPDWSPVFVGYIDPERWFDQEEP